MSTEETKDWDYMCPQFCDFAAEESPNQLQRMDHFFKVDHEMDEQKSTYGENESLIANQTPIECKSKANPNKDVLREAFIEANDGLRYETPPQNKENAIEDEDNEVFYSTKKSWTLEKKKSYKLRSTPMRVLQYNGSTPLRETRISSKKKQKKWRQEVQNTTEDMVFRMTELVESLPNASALVDSTEAPDYPESIAAIEVRIDLEVQNGLQNEVPNDVSNQIQCEDNEELNYEDIDEVVNEVFESENIGNNAESEALNLEIPLTGRESYVIESGLKKVQKSVKLVSPHKSANSSDSAKRRFATSNRRKGTPIRRSTAGANRKVSTQSIVSRLYSTAKSSSDKYKSMAELVKEFESQPRGSDRSRSLDRTGTGSGMRSRSSSVSSLTRPKSPKLQSILRHRRTPRQTEDIIASEIKKYSFKANPIRKKLFDAKFASGIPRVKSVKEPTKAVELHFMTEKRNELRAVKMATNDDKQEVQKMQFKANPMPAFKSPRALQTKSEKKATTFKPFSFDDRIRSLVNKMRKHSEDSQQNVKREPNRKTFRF